MSSTRDAILEGFKKAGWQQPTEDILYQVETAVNRADGRAANEALKKSRRHSAVQEIVHDLPKFVMRTTDEMADWLEGIIEKAQG